MLPLAVDPELNVRIVGGSEHASVTAAERWADSPHGAGYPLWHLLLESIEQDALLSYLGAFRPRPLRWCSSSRAWIALPEADLSRLLERLQKQEAALGREIGNALSAYQQCLHQPQKTLVMGILNVTPDSFSDGGLWTDTEAAVERGLRMVEEGADILDIGGESTRPGAEEVPVEEELRRVLPVVEKLRAQTGALISVDTQKAAVAKACLDAGADWINDVSGLTAEPELADVAAAHPHAKLVLMHSRLRPAAERYSTEYDAQGQPHYEDVVADTMRWLRRQIQVAVARGVGPENLWIDPGFGFGKTFKQNVELLRRLREYTSIGAPLLVGTSRKSTVGRLLGDLAVEERLEGTAATVAWAVAQGAAAVRVHDVKEMARVARVADALR